MNKNIKNILTSIIALSFSAALFAAPSLTTGSGQGRLGETILLPITLNADATNQAMTLTFDVLGIGDRPLLM